MSPTSGKPDGGPAFPVWSRTADNVMTYVADGMSLRDWFAGQALIGMCANPELTRVLAKDEKFEQVAASAYLAADALLAEREK